MRQTLNRVVGGSRVGDRFLTKQMGDTGSPINVLAAHQTGDAIVTFLPRYERPTLARHDRQARDRNRDRPHQTRSCTIGMPSTRHALGLTFVWTAARFAARLS
jgi:hypothetical protein